MKGGRLSITIPEDEYLAGVEDCKHNLHGRILWPHGSKLLTTINLKAKISALWANLGKWWVISLGKGLFEFSFSSLEDVHRVRASGSWNLSPGLFKLFPWTKDFIPSIQNTNSAQVWVRFYGLPQEYWRLKILFAIASSIGTPICSDIASIKPMIDRNFGYYVRVLVDMDVSSEIRYKVLVERTCFAFFTNLEYENLPSFCTHCKKLGHLLDHFRVANQDILISEKTVPNLKKTFIPKPGIVTQIGEHPDGITERNDPNKGKLPLIPETDLGTSKTPLILPNPVEGDSSSSDEPFEECNHDIPDIILSESSDGSFVEASVEEQQFSPIRDLTNKSFLDKAWNSLQSHNSPAGDSQLHIENSNTDDEQEHVNHTFQLVISNLRKRKAKLRVRSDFQPEPKLVLPNFPYEVNILEF